MKECVKKPFTWGYCAYRIGLECIAPQCQYDYCRYIKEGSGNEQLRYKLL